MTVKEFSEKYEIPYRIVFDASYFLPYTIRNNKEKDYDLYVLKEAVYKKVVGVISRYRDKLLLYEQIMMKLLNEP